ncbi:MAG: hypothetical protein VX513_05745 [Pseudomonadota bacterium]|nr:hypothetical protein [Pseudomonadota bacterium]
MIATGRVFHFDLVIKRLGKRVKARRANGVPDREDIIKGIDQHFEEGYAKIVTFPIVSDERETKHQTRLVIDKILPTC